jgi:hypothetical protein
MRVAGSRLPAVSEIATVLLVVAFAASSQANAPAQDKSASLAAPDPRAIVERSLKSFNRDLDLRRNYTYQRRVDEKQYDGSGKLKKSESRTYDVLIVDGEPRMKLIARNDQPLSAEELQQQEENRRKRASRDEEQRKHRGDPKKEEEEERKFVKLIMDCYNFSLAGEDAIDGEPVWVIAGTPNPKFDPPNLEAKLLKKMQGKLWITKRDYQWAKVDAEMIDDFSFGWFLAKLRKGAHIHLEQTRVNDEIWLPRLELAIMSARIGFRSQRTEMQASFSGYKKFRVDAKITDVKEVPEKQ